MTSNEQLISTLKRHILGDVRADQMSRHIYSVDASIFEVPPLAVILAKNKEDLVSAVKIAYEFQVPIIPRGGGTGIAGGCLGSGIVIDTSKHLNHILQFSSSEKFALCEPGVVQDQLNAFVSPFNLRLGADTSTGNRATIGGMCASNAAGAHYLKYGSMIDHVLAVEMILSNGQTIWLDEMAEMEGLPNVSSPPFFHRSSSGYPLYTLLDKSRNLAKLTVGSEGTLGIFSAIKVKLSPTILKKSIAIFSFPSLERGLEAAQKVALFKPISLEIIDHHIIEMGRLSPFLKGKLLWLNFETKSLLIAEFEEDKPPFIMGSQINLIDQKSQNELWTLRKAGLGLLLSRRSYTRAIAFIEDLAVPPQNLPSFIRDLRTIIPWEMGIYGHAGDGCLHTRPYVCVSNRDEMDRIFQIMPSVVELVKKYGGVLSGEHGDGMIRSWLNPQLFGPNYEAMVQIKKVFDPVNLMNPGKIVDGVHPRPFVRKSNPIKVQTFLNFEKEGGLHLAADLCNGNGACRKTTGLMCPSFHAYKDEKHTTRARAQSLRAILNGSLPIQELTEKGLLDVLDYCLECKGCKKECPSQVDMAKMKMEILYQFQEKKGYFFKSLLFGNYHLLASYGSKTPTFSTWAMNSLLMRKILTLLGITSKRSFPPFAPQQFSKWWKKREKHKGTSKIYLFIDTFTEFHSPEVGQSAVVLLEKCGYEIEIVHSLCCGRPFLSTGMLQQAKRHADSLSSYLEKLKDPIVILEPSCMSAMIDDYPSLISHTPKVCTIESVLPRFECEEEILFHPHCHEQALLTDYPLEKFFPCMMVTDAGCCGLAGSFGYDSNHYEMSMAIAENQLFPKIRSHHPRPIAASGFSCRQQISHGLNIKVQHPVQLLLNVLNKR